MYHPAFTSRGEHSKALLKRCGYATGGAITPTPKPDLEDPMKGRGPIERDNYNSLMSSPKGWTKAESQFMATNPSGRLHPDPDAKKYARGGKAKGSK